MNQKEGRSTLESRRRTATDICQLGPKGRYREILQDFGLLGRRRPSSYDLHLVLLFASPDLPGSRGLVFRSVWSFHVRDSGFPSDPTSFTEVLGEGVPVGGSILTSRPCSTPGVSV